MSPVFRVRLEAPDESGHYRVSDIQAPDEDAARAWCVVREHKAAAYQLPDDELARLEQQIADHPDSDDPRVALKGEDRAHWFTHQQAKPYVIVDVQKIKD